MYRSIIYLIYEKIKLQLCAAIWWAHTEFYAVAFVWPIKQQFVFMHYRNSWPYRSIKIPFVLAWKRFGQWVKLVSLQILESNSKNTSKFATENLKKCAPNRFINKSIDCQERNAIECAHFNFIFTSELRQL